MPSFFGKTSVFVDLNHLINMAQEIKRGVPGLFNRLVSLVDVGRIVVPASGLVFLEVFAIKDPEQRKDVGKVLKSLSRRLVIRDYLTVQHMEVTNAVAEHFGDSRRFTLPVLAFGAGYLESLGHVKLQFPAAADDEPELKSKIEEQCWNFIESDEAMDPMLARLNIPKPEERGPDHRLLIEGTRRDREAAKGKSFTRVKGEYILSMMEHARKAFDEAAIDLGILERGLHPSMPAKMRTKEFLDSIPTIRVYSDLNLYLYHQNPDTRVELNDMYDFGHLAVAIPYCDVVVCDKKMADTVRKSGLAATYSTKVFGRLSEAVEYLESLP